MRNHPFHLTCCPKATVAAWFQTVHLILSFAAAGALAFSLSAGAPSFFRSDRGHADGDAPLPDNLDAPGAQAWRTELEPGHSSPVVCDNRIFLTTCNTAGSELATVALNAETGALLWRQAVHVDKMEATHPIGSPATPTPASDGSRVFSFFGSRGLFAYALDGRPLWDVPMGPFQDEYGAGSSPIVVNDLVIVNQDHDVDCFVAAFDAATGKLRWKTPRPDAVRSYATPTVWDHNGRTELLIAGALQLTAYDPANGKPLWWVNGLARIVIPTPAVDGKRIYVASWTPGGDAGKRITLPTWAVAVAQWDDNHDGKLSQTEIKDREILDRFFRMDLNQDGVLDESEWVRHAAVFQKAQNSLLALEPSGSGDVTDSAVKWKHAKGVPYVASPVVTRTGLWMVKEGGIVTHLDASGKVLAEERAAGGGGYYASAVAGDGKVYMVGEQGVLTVVADTPEWRVAGSHDFHEKIYATPALRDGRLFVRTEKALYCFRRPPAN
jgi:outer membrane protein assembly factor BamB